jgi:NADPH2:quinone reductase
MRKNKRASMKAMVCEAFGGPEVLALRDVPDPPPPGPGEIQVRIGARRVDIVYDSIGDKVAAESLRCLAWGGRLLILGCLGGGPANIRSNYLLIKGIDAVGVRIGGLNEANPALALANMKTLTELAAQGKLKPRISHRFRLDQAAQALQAMKDRAVIGKAVLVS